MMAKFNILPKDIRLDILTRLPTESVLECKLVCKPWRDLIHHPSFSQLHLTRHLNSADDDSGKLSFIVVSHKYGFPKFYYTEYKENCHETAFSRQSRMDLDLPFVDYSLARSCNGLICFDSSSDGNSEPAYVCNPITREYIMLPTSKGWYWWTGFGFIPSTNEYKVIKINASGGDSNTGIVQVYTLGSGLGWRNAGIMDVDMKYVRNNSGAFVNGAFHWENYYNGTILAFHLADEKFSELPAPPFWTPGVVANSMISLGVLGDFLSCTSGCDIWLLKRNKDNYELSWSRELSLDNEILRPFGITKSGRFLCYAFQHSKIYSCDPKASSARIDVCFGKSVTEAIPHENTLVSLKVLGEKDTKTMESEGIRWNSSEDEETESNDKLKNPQNEVNDL